MQEYWSGLPFFSPGDLPHPGIKLGSLKSTYIGGWVLYHSCQLGSPDCHRPWVFNKGIQRTHNFLKSLFASHACSVPSAVTDRGKQLFIFLQSSTDFARSPQVFGFFSFVCFVLFSDNRLTLICQMEHHWHCKFASFTFVSVFQFLHCWKAVPGKDIRTI